MNPRLDALRPYPFERLRALLADARPPAGLAPINLSIGEPRHATPPLVAQALTAALGGLAHYPTTQGSDALRGAIAGWIARRHGLKALDPATQVLPVLGSREALFSAAQAIVDASREAAVVMTNPFYQIYEGAALLAGAQPHYLNQVEDNDFRPDARDLPASAWARAQLLYVCSPDNPSGRVLSLADWTGLFELSDRHGFVIAADECYSEIYDDEARPPLGALAAAQALGREGYPRLLAFGSLSKRSNAPGLRSGYVAGDAGLVRGFLRYRTYHGCAMSGPVAAASIAAWGDERHVVDNRREYRAKFDLLQPRLDAVLPCRRPEAGFYLWARTPGDDAEFARGLFAATGVTVLPGSYFARTAGGVNPGAGRVRIALVAERDECAEAIDRIVGYCRGL